MLKEMQLVEIYPYRSFKEKIRLYEQLRKANDCRIEIFDGFFFIEKISLVYAEFDFKKHKRVKKRRRRKKHGKKKIREDCRVS